MSTDLEELELIEAQNNRHGTRTHQRGSKIGNGIAFNRCTLRAKQSRSEGRKSRPQISLPHFSIQDDHNE